MQTAVKKVVQQTILSPETIEDLKNAFVEGGRAASLLLTETFVDATQDLANTTLTVDEVDLKANITGQINVSVENDIGALIRDALLPVIGQNEQLDATVRNITNALIKANFPGVQVIPNQRGN
jgi:hypothetical protein